MNKFKVAIISLFLLILSGCTSDYYFIEETGGVNGSGNLTVNNSLFFQNGAEITDNETCLTLESPNKQDRIEICDNASIHFYADNQEVYFINSSDTKFNNIVSGNGSGLFDVPFDPSMINYSNINVSTQWSLNSTNNHIYPNGGKNVSVNQLDVGAYIHMKEIDRSEVVTIPNHVSIFCEPTSNGRCYIKRDNDVVRRIVDATGGSFHFDEDFYFNTSNIYFEHTDFLGSTNRTICLDSNEKIYLSEGPCDNAYFYVVDSAASVAITGVQTVINLDSIQVNSGHFTLNADTITFNKAGVYQVSYNFNYDVIDSSGGTRGSMEVIAELNEGSGYNEIVGSQSHSYFRESARRSGNQATFLIEVDSSDILRLQRDRVTGSSNTWTLPNESSLTIVKIN